MKNRAFLLFFEFCSFVFCFDVLHELNHVRHLLVTLHARRELLLKYLGAVSARNDAVVSHPLHRTVAVLQTHPQMRMLDYRIGSTLIRSICPIVVYLGLSYLPVVAIHSTVSAARHLVVRSVFRRGSHGSVGTGVRD